MLGIFNLIFFIHFWQAHLRITMRVLNLVVLTIVFSFSFAISSCDDSDNSSSEIKELHTRIMATHDHVMPMIGKVLSLRKQVQTLLDSCTSAACGDSLQAITYNLTKADADMMNWMHSYKEPLGQDTALKYLNNQEVAIAQVKEQILSSIEAAETCLKERQ